MFKLRPDPGHIHAVHPGTEHHAVGIAHVHAGDLPGLPGNLHRIVHHLPLRDIQPEGRGVQGRVAHVHAGRGHPAVGGVDPDGLGALVRLQGHFLLADDTVVIEVLRHTPQGVAGHGALRPVGVEHPHLGIRLPGSLHEDDAVGADAVVPVAEGDAQGLRAGDLPAEILQEDVVVAAGLHLGEGQLLPLRPQMADVDELRVPLVVAAGQDVRQGTGRIQRGQAGNAQLDAPVVQVDEVPDILRLRRAGEDHVVDPAGLQQLEDPVVPAQLAHHLHVRAQAGDLPCGAVGGVEAEGEVERLPCGDAVAVAGGAHEQVGRGRLVLVHALAQRDAELLQRLGGVQIGQVDGQRVAAAVVDDVAEQNDVAVIIILRVRRNLLRRGRAVADVLQAGGVGVVVAVEQLADLAGAGVGEHGGVDARGDLLRLDAVPRRGVVHDLEHDVDLITDLHSGDLAARSVGDGIGGDVDAVGAGRVNGRRRRGGGGGDIRCGDVVCHNRRTQRRRQSKGGQQGK